MISKRISFIFIVLSGEVIFMLPFLVPRVFRPVMLKEFNVTNEDLGHAFFAYGLFAILSYLLGGAVADRFNPKKLITISLLLTSLIGFFFSTIESKPQLVLVYALFGVSTILLMWSALIKLTHDISNKGNRSLLMGCLDGGRGVIAAILISVIVVLSSFEFHDGLSLKSVIIIISIFKVIFAVAFYFFVSIDNVNHNLNTVNLQKVMKTLRNKKAWLMGLIVFCCYTGYKNIDIYSIYLVDVKGVSEAKASQLMMFFLWLRPLSVILTGFLVDYFYRVRKLKRSFALFVILGLAFLLNFMIGFLEEGSLFTSVSIMAMSVMIIYSLRAVYFSIFDEINNTQELIGTIVGMISVIGFLPDLIWGALTGYLIDTMPNHLGYTISFILCGAILAIGSLLSFCLTRTNKKVICEY